MAEASDTPKRPLQLHITLHEARGLLAKDKDTGLSDPFVIFRLGRRHHRSRIIKRTVTPKWNESFRLSGDGPDHQLEVAVRDYDIGAPDEPLGHFTIELSKLQIDEENEQWWPIIEGQGEVRISIKLTRSSPARSRGEASAAGQHFQAVRPWAGAIFPPTNFDPASVKETPAAELRLKHAYGYRSRNCRSNVHILSDGKRFVYHTAALGVVQSLTATDNSQSFFTGHASAEILSLAVDPTVGRYVATGDQVTNYNEGDKTVRIAVWDTDSPGEALSILDCGKKASGIVSITFSAGKGDEVGQYVAAVATNNEHTVFLFDWRKGGPPLASISGHSDKVLDILFHPEDPLSFVTVGVKHVKFWRYNPDTKTLEARKGIFGKLGEIQAVLSVAYQDADHIITGCINGDIYIWDINTREVVHAFKAAHNGPVFSVARQPGVGILSGGKDSRLLLHKDDKSNKVSEFKIPSNTGIRAISWQGDYALVGTDDSSIWLVENIHTGNFSGQHLVEAHSTVSNAEVWGLAVHPSKPEAITVSEDAKAIQWDLIKHKAIISHRFTRNLTDCDYHPSGDLVAVSTEADEFYILRTSDFSVVKEIQVEGGRQTPAVHPVKFSPDGQYLAVGGIQDDNGVAIYDTNSWKIVGVCSGHSSRIIALDWSKDSKFLQTNSLELELLFWAIPSSEQITKSSDLCDTEWATFELPMAWPTTGIWEPGMNGRDINSVARNPAHSLIISGDDFGRVGLHAYPNHKEELPSKKFRGHAAHVTAVKFTADGKWALSVGGLDGTLIQWEVVHD